MITLLCGSYKQVAPAELEHLLQSHPAISDAAVVPYEITLVISSTCLILFIEEIYY